MIRRGLLWGVCAAALLAASAACRAEGTGLDEAVNALQRDWEVIRYQTPANERDKRFQVLAGKAHKTSERFADRSEPLVCEGTILSAWAEEKNWFSAFMLTRQAKAAYEAAIQIDGSALEGSAYSGLGSLYARVPGWPLGFGDMAKARELLEKALALAPDSIDANVLFAEYLLRTRHPEEATAYLERALQAPARPGHQIADTGRREEARLLLDKARARER